MTFDQFMQENSTEYKGYTIGPGSIRKDGEIRFIFHHPLDAPKEEAFKQGMEIIDEQT